MVSTYSIDPTGECFTRDGVVIPGVTIRVRRGRSQYVSDSGKVLASGMSPETFARRFWYASQWREPHTPV